MIGKPEWFRVRKYGGWGLNPKTWQGWVYIGIILIPLIVFQSLPFWNNTTRIAATVCWLVLLFIDVIDIMIHMKKDEREKYNEAIAERNVAWFVILVLAMGLVYDIIINAMQEKIYVNPVIAIALFGGWVVKLISNVYLDRHN